MIRLPLNWIDLTIKQHLEANCKQQTWINKKSILPVRLILEGFPAKKISNDTLTIQFLLF